MNLRTMFVILLILGFVYTSFEVKENFTELRVNCMAQIETVLGG